MKLDKQTVLELADELRVEIHGGVRLTLEIGDQRFAGGPQSLALLSAFTVPRPMEDGLRIAVGSTKSRDAWVGLAAELRRLFDRGVLQPVGHQRPLAPTDIARFDTLPVHIRMLNDHARTLAFQEAIRATVGPDDVVLDIGTGTGILALTAAAAGARHVYAVERTAAARFAAAQIEGNGFHDRITLIRGSSTAIELPERANVLVSEIIGDDPLTERVRETTSDARRRLLTEDARTIPSRVMLRGLPVEVPAQRRRQAMLDESAIAEWTARYDLDFSALFSVVSGQAARLSARPQKAADWPRFSEPIALADVELGVDDGVPIRNQVSAEVTRTGEITGVLVYFELEMRRGQSYSIHPDEASAENHWASLVWLPPEPIPVTTGDDLEIIYVFESGRSSFELPG